MNKLSLVCFASALFGLTGKMGAAPVPVAYGDLILGFKADGGTGAETNLEVNLGPASDFYGAAAGTAKVLAGLSVQDLIDTYGDDWATRTDLFWGVAGTVGAAQIGDAPARTVWTSRAETTAGVASTPWLRNVQFTLQSPSTAISGLYTGGEASMDKGSATSGSAASVKVAAATAGSWTYQESLTPNISFKYFSPSVMMPMNLFPAGSAYDGTGYAVMDLWEVRPGTAGSPATLVGGIGINSEGKLVFSTDITIFAPSSTPPAGLDIPTIVYAGGTVTVSLGGLTSGSFVLERSPSMADGSWTSLQTKSPASGVVSFDDTAPLAPRGFYRIRKGS